MDGSIQRRKVFISWGGRYAGDVAKALYDWLKHILDTSAELWISRGDIEPGARSLEIIKNELNETSFGVIVLTKEGMLRPWVNFEAGALSKAVGDAEEPPIVPVLVDLEGPAQVQGPLEPFQAVKLDREGIQSLVRRIASYCGMNETSINKRLDSMYGDLEKQLGDIAPDEDGANRPKRDQYDLISEILERLRWQESHLGISQETHRKGLIERVRGYCEQVEVPVLQFGWFAKEPGEPDRMAVYTTRDGFAKKRQIEAVVMSAGDQLGVHLIFLHDEAIEQALS